MADYRFARRPVWLAGHLLAASTVALMVSLGVWQLDRLDQRRDQNDLVEARAALDPVEVGEQLDPGDGRTEADALRFAAVTATGSYTGTSTVVRANQDGASGGRVFTVLALDGGESVLVLRGFVAPGADGSVPAPEPPAGEVVVEGLAIPTRRLEVVSRRAIDELVESDEALAASLLPVVVQAAAPDTEELVEVPVPDLGEGPHLGYAVQWFLFSAVVAVGYPLLLHRRAREAGS